MAILLIVSHISVAVVCYLVGANNPLSSVKQRIKDSVNKL